MQLILKYVHILHLNIELQYQHEDYFKDNLEKYEVDKKPNHIDYVIKVSYEQDLSRFEQSGFEIFSKNKQGIIKSGALISDHIYNIFILKDYFENEANAEYIYMGVVFLKIALKEHVFPLHASTILYKNEAVAFSGPSKIGKSTHTSLWETYVKDSKKLNDDKTMLTFEGKSTYANGIPFSGAESININKSVKLKAIVFLKQAKVNKIYKMKPKIAALELVKNIYQPNKANEWQLIFDQIEIIINNIPIYTLACDISEEAVSKAFDAVYKGDTDEN